MTAPMPVPTFAAASRVDGAIAPLAPATFRQKVGEAVARFVAAQLGVSLRFSHVSADGAVVHLTGPRRGQFVAISGSVWGEVAIVRGVLRLVHRHRRWTYLPNGQAGTNTRQLAFWGESAAARCNLREWGDAALLAHLDAARLLRQPLERAH